MNLIWLDDFLVLAASGNFSRAASARHTTQPAFSRRIRALEEWLGTELFDRSSQPAKLTDAGEWFRTVAQDLLNQVARVPGEARAVAEASSGTLRLAATHALSFTFMPLWLRSLEAHTSVGPIRLVSDVLTQCEALMQQGKVQFVLSHTHVHAQGQLDVASYPSIRVGQDQLLPVSAANASGAPMHTLAMPRSKSAQVNLLDYSLESGIGRIVRKVHGGALGRLPVQIVFTAHLASVLRTMVLDGRGLAWLPRTLIATIWPADSSSALAQPNGMWRSIFTFTATALETAARHSHSGMRPAVRATRRKARLCGSAESSPGRSIFWQFQKQKSLQPPYFGHI